MQIHWNSKRFHFLALGKIAFFDKKETLAATDAATLTVAHTTYHQDLWATATDCDMPQ